MDDDRKKRDIRETSDLRRRAQARLDQSERSAEDRDLSPREAAALIHELQTHQVELELQNEDLREAQLALTAAHDRYLALYDFAPVGYLTLEGAGKIIEANLRASELIGSPRAKLINGTFSSFVAEDDQDALFLCMRKLRSEGKRQEVDLRLRRPDPEIMWVRSEWVPARDQEHSDCVRVTLNDITEYKHLQAQLALADRLSSAGLLAASIGHEVNNPLTYVLYNLETVADDLPEVIRRLAEGDAALQSGAPSRQFHRAWLTDARMELEDIAKRAESAMEGAQRIRDLVKGIRIFSRVDEELIEPLSLNAVIETALTMTSREIGSRARLIKDLGEVSRVSANHGQMCQVFVNLLVNAAQAIEEGRVDDNQVRIRTWSDADQVLAEVADTGCGIAAENLERIFDPFFTTKPAGSGTGLGLSICMKIVNALGGRLSVKSTVNKGTTFTIRLPATAERQKAPGDPGSDLPSERLRGRILIIDDEPVVRETIAQMLNEHEVVLAASGREGREVLSTDPEFDVILCDLMMPDVSGIDLLTWLGENQSSLASRVVLITGGAFTPRSREFLAKTGQPRLEKPFDVKRLRGLVQRMMKGTETI